MRSTIARMTVHPIAIPLVFPRFTSDGRSTHTVRTILQLEDSEGRIGLGLVSPAVDQGRLASASKTLVGWDPFRTNELAAHLLAGKFVSLSDNILYGGLEMAMLDLQGRILDLPVSDLLGGRRHDRVPVSAVLYREGSDDDASVADPSTEPVVRQAEMLTETYGFTIFKFKAGAAPIEDDIQVMSALRDRFPRARLRIDPNGSWTAESTRRALPALAELGLDWVEDPVLGRSRMGEVTRSSPVPTATNMCITNFNELHDGLRASAASVILTDIGYAAGLRRAQAFTLACQAVGLGTAVHCGPLNQTGVGLAATLHFASTLPDLIHGVDGIEYLNQDDVMQQQVEYTDGCLGAPVGPGLGVSLDAAKLARYEEEFARVASAKASAGPKTPGQYPRY